jgi:phosphoserine phosphatase
MQQQGQRPEVAEQNDGWAITLIARNNVEHALGPAVDIVKEQGLELDRVRVLAGPELGPNPANYACMEIHAYGSEPTEARLRAEYAKLTNQLATETPTDIVLQRESALQQPRRLFCFDMDSTLIQAEVIDELAKMAGVADRVVAITASAMRGEIEFQESFRRRVALLAGLPESRTRELLDRIPLMEGVERLFRTLHQRGAKTAILSGGFTFFGHYLQQRLGVHHVHANELHVDTLHPEMASFVTGQVQNPIVDGARKAALLQQIATEENISLAEVVAVGDGANDLPMLGLAGMGVAFHAKPVVRAAAKYSVTYAGLDALLFLLGIPEKDWAK